MFQSLHKIIPPNTL